MPDTDSEEYWDCGPTDREERADLDDAQRLDYERGELLRAVKESGGDVREFAREVMIADDTCGGENVAYTGVHPGGEKRECPSCMESVEVDPIADEVTHVG